MSAKPESILVGKIKDALKARWGADIWVVKIHGGLFQVIGLPDLIGCYRGRLFAFEVKRLLPSGRYASEVTVNQQRTLDAITRAGGIARVIASAAEAEAALA